MKRSKVDPPGTGSNGGHRIMRLPVMGKLGRNTLWVGLGQVVNLALAFVLTPIAARALGDEDFGRYSLAATLMFFVFLFDDLGLNTWITKEAAGRRESSISSVIGDALSFKLVVAIPLLTLLALVLKLIGVDNRTSQAIVVFAVYGILSSVWQLSIAVFRAFETMKYEPLIFALEKLLITTGAILVFACGGGLIHFVAVFPISGIGSAILSYFLLKRHGTKISLTASVPRWVSMVRHSFPFGLSVFLATVYNKIDILILSAMTVPAVVGWYSAAYRLLNVTNLIPTVVATAMFPRFASLKDQGREDLSELFSEGIRVLLAVCVPMIILGMAFARPVIILLFGTQFEPSIPAIRILVWASGIVFFNIYLSSFLGALGYQTRVVKTQILGTLLNVLANVLLIPRWQHLGAATATVLTEALILTVLVRIAVPRLVTLTGLRIGIPVVASSAALIGAILLTRQGNFGDFLSGSLAGLAYVLSFTLLGGHKELRLFQV